MFEAECQRDGRDPTETLQTYLGDVDPQKFWDSVGANISTRTVRLLFVADLVPIELQRIIEFLNDQLRFADVLGIEVQQYTAPDTTMRVLVPRVVGRTSRAADVKAPFVAAEVANGTRSPSSPRSPRRMSTPPLHNARSIGHGVKESTLFGGRERNTGHSICAWPLMGRQPRLPRSAPLAACYGSRAPLAHLLRLTLKKCARTSCSG